MIDKVIDQKTFAKENRKKDSWMTSNQWFEEFYNSFDKDKGIQPNLHLPPKFKKMNNNKITPAMVAYTYKASSPKKNKGNMVRFNL